MQFHLKKFFQLPLLCGGICGAIMLALVAMPHAAWAQDAKAGVAAYDNGDYKTALQILAPLAEGGDAEAQYTMGLMHRFGQGVRKKPRTAAKFFRAAAFRGHSGAQNTLGIIYANGDGVRGHIGQSYFWFTVAVMNGNAAARMGRGQLAEVVRGEGVTAAEIAEVDAAAANCIAGGYADCDPD